MTTQIDKKVVSMSFENSDFEKNVGKSLNTIDQLKKGLDFKDAGKSFDGLSESAGKFNLNHIASTLDDVKNRFSLMGIVGITILQNLTNQALDLGKKLLSAFIGIDSIKAGFGSYETKINAIKTVMSGTGETIGEVTQNIDELNKYSDRTIYSFEDMTSNISKFTNAGLSSKAAATAIQGISNVAAISGANTQDAARAMYNFGQAMQQGSIRLMDWKSIENANMATVEFKTQLLEAAVAEGTLSKSVDGTYKVLKNGSVISATKGFNDSLQEQWLTTGVLTKTLGDYASTETDIGKKANDAATKVRTFTQMIATLADSLKTGWTKSFSTVVGDLNQATELFSTISGFLDSTVIASARARNGLLQGWSDLGGRTKLLEAFENILNSIVAIANQIVPAFKEFFPPMTAERLYAITDGINELTKKFKMALEKTDVIKRAFRGIFAVIDIGKMFITSFLKVFGTLSGTFSNTGNSLADLVGRFGDFLVSIRNSIKSADIFTTIFTNILAVIKPLVSGVIDFFASLISGFKKTDDKIESNSFGKFLATLSEKFKEFGKLGIIFSKIFTVISKIAEKFGPAFKLIGSKVVEGINFMLDALTTGLSKIDPNTILNFINTGLLGGILISFKEFFSGASKVAGGGFLATLLLSVKDFIDSGGGIFKSASGILDGVKDSLKAYQSQLKSNTLLKIAGAIAILVGSILVLTLLDQGKLVNAVAAISGMFIALTTTLDVFEKASTDNTKMITMTAALIGVSAALLVMSGVIVILSKLSPEEVIQGVSAVGGILGLLLLFQKFSMGSGTGMVGSTAGLLLMSVGLLAIGVAIRSLGGMDIETIAKGLGTMAASLGIIGVALSAMTGTIAGAGSLLIASGAIIVLAVALQMMGALSLSEIGIALLAIAGAFTVLGLAGYILTPIAPGLAIVAVSLLAIGAAAGLFGLAILGIGLGIGALVTALVALSTISAVGLAAITLVVTGVTALFPIIATQVANGFVSFMEVISNNIPKLVTAFTGIGLALVVSFSNLAPQLVATVLKLLLDLLIAVDEKMPDIVEKGGHILIGFLTGMSNNIGQIVTLGYDIVTKFINAVAEKLPDLAQSAWGLIISWINAISLAAETNIPLLMEAVRGLGSAIVKGIIAGVIGGNIDSKNAIIEIAQMMIDGFKEFLGIKSPSTVFMELASQIIEGIRIALETGISIVVDVMTTLASSILTPLTNQFDSMVIAGSDLVSGLAQGITNFIGTAIDAASNLATTVLTTIKHVLDAHSPSRKLFEVGGDIDAGLAGGISAYSGRVTSSVKDLGNTTINSFSDILSRVSESVNNSMDFNPSIKPVIDFSDIQKGSNAIDGILGKKSLSVGLADIAANNISSAKSVTTTDPLATNDPASGQNISFTQNNYSPKELSRLEIYRQTQNQVRQMKQLVGA